MLVDRDGYLRALDWTDYLPRMHRLLRLHYGDQVDFGPPRRAHVISRALDRYFAGDLTAIDTIPVRTAGTTFQRLVWQALRKIPSGTTVSYSQLASRIGRANAPRAVGAACGANPIGIVVPCHRVIGSHGSLVNYGGGIKRKEWLLAHEGLEPPAPPRTAPPSR
jgi:methylated-DNA-[protein]-cysteine S-methyltransferase